MPKQKGRPRATAKQLELSGLNKIQKARYAAYNFTDGVPITSINPPPGVLAETKEAFKITVSALLQMKVLSQTDVVSLYELFYCVNETYKAKKAIAKFDKEHPVLMDKELINQRRTLNSWFMASIKEAQSLAREFGLTPSSRTGLPLNQDDSDKGKDPLDQLLQV